MGASLGFSDSHCLPPQKQTHAVACVVLIPLPSISMGILSFIYKEVLVNKVGSRQVLNSSLHDCSLSFCEAVQTIWGCWETSWTSVHMQMISVKLKVGVSWILQADYHFLCFSRWPQVITRDIVRAASMAEKPSSRHLQRSATTLRHRLQSLTRNCWW